MGLTPFQLVLPPRTIFGPGKVGEIGAGGEKFVRYNALIVQWPGQAGTAGNK